MIPTRSCLFVVAALSAMLALPASAATPHLASRATDLQRYVITTSDVTQVFGGRFVPRKMKASSPSSANGLLGMYVEAYIQTQYTATVGTVVAGLAQATDAAHARAAYRTTLLHSIGMSAGGTNTHSSTLKGVGDEAQVATSTTPGSHGVGSFKFVSVSFRRGVYAGIVVALVRNFEVTPKIRALAATMARRLP